MVMQYGDDAVGDEEAFFRRLFIGPALTVVLLLVNFVLSLFGGIPKFVGYATAAWVFLAWPAINWFLRRERTEMYAVALWRMACAFFGWTGRRLQEKFDDLVAQIPKRPARAVAAYAPQPLLAAPAVVPWSLVGLLLAVVAVIAVGAGLYFWGKSDGVKDTTAKYERAASKQRERVAESQERVNTRAVNEADQTREVERRVEDIQRHVQVIVPAVLTPPEPLDSPSGIEEFRGPTDADFERLYASWISDVARLRDAEHGEPAAPDPFERGLGAPLPSSGSASV